MVRPDGTISPSEFVIKVMLVNWVVNAYFYLLASYSLPVYMNYNINLQWNEQRAVSTYKFMKIYYDVIQLKNLTYKDNYIFMIWKKYFEHALKVEI
ncbi:hypothetical protein T07_5009 [Trichinella nelsoni]|uniref:Uncharacterized protein n=1 Tax=Trichinella nelsoni TaxID=6336 RepID=A0A0V0RYD3_9BILA|nr:hypothetical protein T07_5009 [Trichinella nelsoni]